MSCIENYTTLEFEVRNHLLLTTVANKQLFVNGLNLVSSKLGSSSFTNLTNGGRVIYKDSFDR